MHGLVREPGDMEIFKAASGGFSDARPRLRNMGIEQVI